MSPALFRLTSGVALLCAQLTMLSADDFYLSTTGDDAAQGTLAAPWLTFNHAASQLQAGDTLYVRGGNYSERLILTAKTGTVHAPILIRNYQSETTEIDGSLLTVPTGGRAGLVVIENCDYITLQGLSVQNYQTSASGSTPVGIQIEGSGRGIRIIDCTVEQIWQNSTNSNANGFGIAVYGTSLTPIDELILKGNTIHNLRTGQSESVVLNGNVTNFLVTQNHVYDCNNIGIDFIGYEGSAPATVDRARNGICSENLVHAINSAYNPGYGGSFNSGGGDESAAGIYVDGGHNIVIERNEIFACNFGIELASEYAAGVTDAISVRNNLLHHNRGPGIIMGGYDSARGTTRFCNVSNNTLYRNDTELTYGGQIALQFYLENNTFTNNILWANTSTKQMIIHYVEGGTAAKRTFDTTTNTFDYNLYYCEGDAADIEFGLNPTGNGSDAGNKSYYGLAAWRTITGSDAHSSFGDPGFTLATPNATPTASDFKLTASSYARDLGEPASSFTPADGEKDFFGASRVANGRVDGGMHEYMTDLQAWRDRYFELPDGQSSAHDLNDPDYDTIANLVEYSQGMNPTIADSHLAPQLQQIGNALRFTYRKDAAELTYQVQTSTNLLTWPASVKAEESDTNGNYWHDFPIAESDRRLVRLEVQ